MGSKVKVPHLSGHAIREYASTGFRVRCLLCEHRLRRKESGFGDTKNANFKLLSYVSPSCQKHRQQCASARQTPESTDWVRLLAGDRSCVCTMKEHIGFCSAFPAEPTTAFVAYILVLFVESSVQRKLTSPASVANSSKFASSALARLSHRISTCFTPPTTVVPR